MPTAQGEAVNAIEVTPDTGPVFQENWFDTPALTSLAGHALRVAGLPGAVIEVGCWEGKSTIHLANTLAQVSPQQVIYAVDTWAGNLGEGPTHPTVYEIQHHGRDVYQRFLDNVKASGHEGRIIPVRMDWRDFFAAWKTCGTVDTANGPHAVGGPIKLLHIDGDHTYNSVRDNILAAAPFLVRAGCLCGDDYGCPPVGDAVRDTFGANHGHDGLWFYYHIPPEGRG